MLPRAMASERTGIRRLVRVVRRLSGLAAKLVTAIGSIASMVGHGVSLANAAPFLIEPESIDTLHGVRPYLQSFVQASNTRFLFGSNSITASWQGSNVLLMHAGPHERASWE